MSLSKEALYAQERLNQEYEYRPEQSLPTQRPHQNGNTGYQE